MYKEYSYGWNWFVSVIRQSQDFLKWMQSLTRKIFKYGNFIFFIWKKKISISNQELITIVFDKFSFNL